MAQLVLIAASASSGASEEQISPTETAPITPHLDKMTSSPLPEAAATEATTTGVQETERSNGLSETDASSMEMISACNLRDESEAVATSPGDITITSSVVDGGAQKVGDAATDKVVGDERRRPELGMSTTVGEGGNRAAARQIRHAEDSALLDDIGFVERELEKPGKLQVS